MAKSSHAERRLTRAWRRIFADVAEFLDQLGHVDARGQIDQRGEETNSFGLPSTAQGISTAR
jgi:hypothetical protein